MASLSPLKDAVTENRPTVAEIVRRLKSAMQQLDQDTAAYAQLMRTHKALTHSASVSAGIEPPRIPILSWVANINDQPVEIQTDVSEMALAEQCALVAAMAATHVKGMKHAASRMKELSSFLDQELAAHTE
jgi:hypothetical protein